MFIRKYKVKLKQLIEILLQVGQGPGYVLRVGGFDNSLSTLGDSFYYNSGMTFSAKLVKFLNILKSSAFPGTETGMVTGFITAPSMAMVGGGTMTALTMPIPLD